MKTKETRNLTLSRRKETEGINILRLPSGNCTIHLQWAILCCVSPRKCSVELDYVSKVAMDLC